MDCDISIIVPVYKVEKYLKRCIESILNQTFREFELILVDDGSPDKCGEICDSYAKKDNRVKVIHKANGGLSSARNAGLDIANGDYIGFVDSDDYIHKKMYERLYNTAIENKSDIVVCDYKLVYKNSKEDDEILDGTNKVNNITNEEALNKLYGISALKYVISCNKLYKAQLFKGLRYEEGRLHEDEFIIHKLLYKSIITTEIDLKLYYYYQRENSITGNKTINNWIDITLALKERLEFMNKNHIDLLNESANSYIYYFFNAYYNIKDNYENKKDVLLMLRKDYKLVLYTVLKNINYNWKEKTLLIIFAINPYLYDVYRNRRKSRGI